MDRIVFTIDGQAIAANRGMTILEAALENDIYIPHLCFHPDLEPAGVCRLCMVDVEGRGLLTSCNTLAKDGMIIKTETPEVNKVRHTAAELLVLNHPPDCLVCEKNAYCELQKVAQFVGIEQEKLNKLRKSPRELSIDASNPFFVYDQHRCVLCGICIRTCREIASVGNLDFAFRGYNSIVSTFGNKPMIESRCVSCGECVARCPVGALKTKDAPVPSREVKTTCTYCGVGCGILLGVRGDRIVSVHGDRENQVNKGRLCVKGRFGYEFINHADRLTKPLVRKNGSFVETTWDEALAIVAERLSHYRGERFAALSSAKCTNEDNYVMQKFTRAVMGTNTIDHCARLCHAPSVAGLAQSLGSGAMTNSIAEIKDTKCLFVIGANTTSAHPVIGYEILSAAKKGAKLIVANPKEIALCEHADLFLRHRPGTDVALLMGICRVIVEKKLHDLDFIGGRCENFEEFAKSLGAFSLSETERITGVPASLIEEAAAMYASRKPGMLFYAMGITQHTHGTDNVLATSNLALLTGNLGKPSSGVNPLRGQNNVQGACDMGALPNVYPGYQRVNLPEIRQKFERAWGVPLSETAGITHLEIFDAIIEGKIKALYQMGENPALSEANASHVYEALAKLEFFVAQDIFLTESARFAHVVLPAASFAEKDGTFTNTERRVQRVRKAVDPVGQSKPDWGILCELALAMGSKGFDFKSPAHIMEEIAHLTPSYGGITYERIERQGIPWPCPSQDSPGTPILHTHFFATQSGRGKFVPLAFKPPFELPDEEYPLVLTTDRSLYHFHTATMTRKGGLSVLRGEELVEIHPEDAGVLGLSDGEIVRVVSRRGEVKSRVKVTEASPEGVVCMTFHFAESPTNLLTSSAMDPVAKIPETKVCAVRIEKLSC